MLQSVVLILLIPAVNRVEGGGGRGETLSSEETVGVGVSGFL